MYHPDINQPPPPSEWSYWPSAGPGATQSGYVNPEEASMAAPMSYGAYNQADSHSAREAPPSGERYLESHIYRMPEGGDIVEQLPAFPSNYGHVSQSQMAANGHHRPSMAGYPPEIQGAPSSYETSPHQYQTPIMMYSGMSQWDSESRYEAMAQSSHDNSHLLPGHQSQTAQTSQMPQNQMSHFIHPSPSHLQADSTYDTSRVQYSQHQHQPKTTVEFVELPSMASNQTQSASSPSRRRSEPIPRNVQMPNEAEQQQQHQHYMESHHFAPHPLPPQSHHSCYPPQIVHAPMVQASHTPSYHENKQPTRPAAANNSRPEKSRNHSTPVPYVPIRDFDYYGSSSPANSVARVNTQLYTLAQFPDLPATKPSTPTNQSPLPHQPNQTPQMGQIHQTSQTSQSSHHPASQPFSKSSPDLPAFVTSHQRHPKKTTTTSSKSQASGGTGPTQFQFHHSAYMTIVPQSTPSPASTSTTSASSTASPGVTTSPSSDPLSPSSSSLLDAQGQASPNLSHHPASFKTQNDSPASISSSHHPQGTHFYASAVIADADPLDVELFLPAKKAKYSESPLEEYSQSSLGISAQTNSPHFTQSETTDDTSSETASLWTPNDKP